MNRRLARKISATTVFLSICVFAQAHIQEPGVRLPGEAPPQFAFAWGATGTGDGLFDYPVGIALDTSGNVYVADVNNHRIQKFDSSGTFLAEWGTNGTGNGEFDGPRDVAVDASGNVYVVDTGNHRIQKFDGSGTYQAQWGSQGGGDGYFNDPFGVAVDAAGNVYVADTYNHRIQKFNSAGTLMTKWGANGSGNAEFSFPYDVAVDASGKVYVADSSNHRIQKFDSYGAYITKWGTSGAGDGQFAGPHYVAVDPSGSVYVGDTDNDRIQKFDSSGAFLSKWGTVGTGDGQFDNPLGVAVDTSGNVYVADNANDRIQKFSAPAVVLVFLTEWGTTGSSDGEFNTLFDVATDSSGNVYVADSGNDRIQKFDSSGGFITKWGTPGSAAGELDDPKAVAVDASGNVFVADAGNYRIQKFNSSGAFLLAWGWGVDDGTAEYQVCTSASVPCQTGTSGTGDGQFISPYGVAVDTSGNVYVSDLDDHRVQKFDGSGGFITKWGASGTGAGQFSWPAGVDVDASGNVYVIEMDNKRVQKFDSGGTFLLMWGWGVDTGASAFETCVSSCQAGTSGSGDGQFTGPFGLAVDASSNVYVIDVFAHRMQVFDSSGTYLNKWGLLGAGDGEFTSPYGVGADSSGNVYAADTGNSRIQKFGHCSFSTAPGSGFFTFAGGASTFDVDPINPACGWSVAADQSWITVTSGHKGLGDGSVGYSVDPNPAGQLRAGTITLTDQSTAGTGLTFGIIQDPVPCTYGLSSSSASFSGASGTDSVNVTALLGCAWTAVSNDGWITIDFGATGNGNGAVLYTVDANAGSAARSGTMTIAGHTFTVNQDPQSPDAPSNLACAAVNSTKISLDWTDNAGNEAEMRVERKLGAAGTFAQIAVLPPDTNGFLDTGLQRHTEYVYRVLACNSAGCSAPSNEATETTPAFGVFIGEVSR